MTSTTQKLMDQGLAAGAPPFLKTNVHYETIMGSHAYGVADTSVKSKVPDFDVYGFAIPPKELIFPHLAGHIPGFGPEPPNFEQFQKHHMFEEDALGGIGKEWDLQIFNIVKFFELCRENNPNMIDSLYTPENCVIHCTRIGRMVRDSRRLFLSKESWKKFRGYAQSQLKKMNDKTIVASGTLIRIKEFEEQRELSPKITLAQIKAEIAKRKTENTWNPAESIPFYVPKDTLRNRVQKLANENAQKERWFTPAMEKPKTSFLDYALAVPKAIIAWIRGK